MYRQKPEVIEAVKFDSIVTALKFLEPGEYPVVEHDCIYLNTDMGLQKVYLGETYLVRRNGKIGWMDAEMFEDIYEEAT